MKSKKYKGDIIQETFGDYLKAIYMLSLDTSPVSTSSLAREMKVTNASASDMLRRLHKEGYVKHIPYQGVTLTDKGTRMAFSLLRRHRLWEVFLINTLHVPLPYVHQYAELLEHSTDDSLEDYLDAFLGYPQKDPHGNPIPTKDGKISEPPRFRLTELPENHSAEVVQFTDEHPELLKYLQELGIQVGSRLTIQKRIAYDRSLQILVNQAPVHLSEKIASTLIVRLSG